MRQVEESGSKASAREVSSPTPCCEFVLTHMCRNRIADGGGRGPTQKLPALGRLSPLLEVTIRDPFTELGVDARSIEEGPQELSGTWKGKGKAKEREESGVRKQSRC